MGQKEKDPLQKRPSQHFHFRQVLKSPAGRVCRRPTGNSCALFCRGPPRSPRSYWTLPPLPPSWSEVLVTLKERGCHWAYIWMVFNVDTLYVSVSTMVHASFDSSAPSSRPSVLISAHTKIQSLFIHSHQKLSFIFSSFDRNTKTQWKPVWLQNSTFDWT